MTTIACDGESMSADGLEISDDDVIIAYSCKKLYRLPNGDIVGAAGDSADIERFVKWMSTDDVETPSIEKMNALILKPDGSLVFYDEKLMPVKAEVPAAVGSGAVFALTAMDMGANPEQAVGQAIKRDVFSGGNIQTIRLSDNL